MADSPTVFSVRRKNGEVIQVPMLDYHNNFTNDLSLRFPKYETAFRYHRCITDGFLGNAPVQLCNARRMLSTIALIYQNSGGKDPLASESPIPQAWYCMHK